MTEALSCISGDWVEISYVLLEPGERSTNLPEETAEKPLVVWVKGFAHSAAAEGDTLEVDTMTGRVVSGTLVDVNPGYTHTFGRPAPELVHVGRDLRARLVAYRASQPSAEVAPAGAPRPDLDSDGDSWW